jgi:hypothetical protein
MTRGIKSRIKQYVDRLAAYVLDGDAQDINRELQRRAPQETADFVAANIGDGSPICRPLRAL